MFVSVWRALKTVRDPNEEFEGSLPQRLYTYYFPEGYHILYTRQVRGDYGKTPIWEADITLTPTKWQLGPEVEWEKATAWYDGHAWASMSFGPIHIGLTRTRERSQMRSKIVHDAAVDRASIVRQHADVLHSSDQDSHVPPFKEGDPCGACQSTKTYWDNGSGFCCGQCGATDMDE